jgi:hypothetical protein
LAYLLQRFTSRKKQLTLRSLRNKQNAARRVRLKQKKLEALKKEQTEKSALKSLLSSLDSEGYVICRLPNAARQVVHFRGCIALMKFRAVIIENEETATLLSPMGEKRLTRLGSDTDQVTLFNAILRQTDWEAKEGVHIPLEEFKFPLGAEFVPPPPKAGKNSKSKSRNKRR